VGRVGSVGSVGRVGRWGLTPTAPRRGISIPFHGIQNSKFKIYAL